MSSTPPARRRVVLGVAGGIAAYKAVELLRALTEAGHDVDVVPTAAALRFVGAPTWEALSHRPVRTDVWTDAAAVPHVALGRSAELIVVAPATADLLARAAHGLADDLLTNVLLTARCPVLMAPAMHTEMWEHPATRANVTTLRERGVVVVDPAVGRLTGTDTGPGRLPEPDEVYRLAELLLHRPDALPRDLVGRAVVITAGGTREALDPVRYLGNHSSGRQGFALAAVAAARGADVHLIAANAELGDPAGIRVSRVSSAAELARATDAAAPTADVVVMAAAVADFRPDAPSEYKIKKDAGAPPSVALTANPDILAGLVARRGGSRRPVLVGFAAETGDADHNPVALGRRKLEAKGCDLLVVNRVGPEHAFGRPDNAATILDADGGQTEVTLGPKAAVAATVWDRVVQWSVSHPAPAAGAP